MIRPLDGVAPRIHESAFVSEFAYVIGDVEIGPESSVWPGAVIRADSGRMVIGARSNVQDNSVLHADANARIGDDVTIGHGVVCHARLIGDGCLVGNGAVLNDGVELAPRCLVAAGSTVIENMNVLERSMLVGSPARIRGEVKDRHLKLMAHAAAEYVGRVARYKRSGGLE